jgi:hypothetical protein
MDAQCERGRPREGIDLEVENIAAGEIAFVQVKSTATQSVLDDYIGRFAKRRDHYARMIFVVHSPVGKLLPPDEPAVQVWTVEEVARLVVRLGLVHGSPTNLPKWMGGSR